MMDAWHSPHHQQDHILSTLDGPSPAGQRQLAQTNVEYTIQDCSCPICSTARYDNQMAQRAIEYQNSRVPNEPIAPYANQNFAGGYPASTTAGDQPLAWPVDPQALNQESVGYAPLQGGVAPFQIQTGAAPDQIYHVSDMPVPERLRRLARRYVDNSESVVNGVHLESGPSGEIQAVITIKIGNIL